MRRLTRNSTAESRLIFKEVGKMKRISLLTVTTLLVVLMLGMGQAQMSTLTPHAPIVISGNGAFTAANGVIAGAGTLAAPYIIQGWEINAVGAQNGIYIENTDAYFIIRNVRVHHADADGIRLINVKNGKIQTSEVFLNNQRGVAWKKEPGKEEEEPVCGGIWLLGSGSNEIAANKVFENNGVGICLDRSQDDKVLENAVLSNKAHGILLNESPRNWIEGNRVSQNRGNGIALWKSSSNKVSDNTVESHRATGILSGGSDNEISGNKVTDNMRGIGIWGSNHLISENTIVSNEQVGIWSIWWQGAWGTSKIVKNTISGNSDGILLVGSVKNVLEGNTLSNNNGVGIYMETSSENVLKDNVVEGSEHGMAIVMRSDNNTISGNEVRRNVRGTLLYDLRGVALEANRIEENDTGIVLHSANESSVQKNKVERNRIGILIEEISQNDTIKQNNIAGNTEYGMRNETTAVIDATENWWGNPTGPYNPVRNPGGRGDGVSDNINFEPWLLQPAV